MSQLLCREWIGLGVGQHESFFVDWIGLGQEKVTHVQLWYRCHHGVSLSAWYRPWILLWGLPAGVRDLFSPAGSILSVESNQNVESKTKNVESKIAFGQLIFRKIIKTVAIRWQILRLKCTKSKIRLGLCPDPVGGAYSALQTRSWI